MSDITFPDAKDGVINCRSNPMGGVRVKVRLLPDTQIGAVLKLNWQGYTDQAGKQPIVGTETSLKHAITSEDISEGVVITVGDWSTHIKPIKDGSARATYAINGGEVGDALVQVRLLNAAGQSCDEV
ncbi:hypothetical protein AB1J88_10970 [Pseudomonas sp. S8]|uniref:hypothetical protein n=1 Tax=Pseudomonas sp. S8 TaxID=211136 RepID=UPI003D27E501